MSERGDAVCLGNPEVVSQAGQKAVVRESRAGRPPEAGAGEDGEDRAEPARDYIFEPSPQQLLETLLPRYVEVQVFEALLEAAASEQSARMVAMRNATDSANEMVDDLKLTYNKARQELVTSELLDIVGGKAALEQTR